MKIRLTLLNSLLLMGTIATWTAVWVQQRETARYELQLPGLQNAARELVIDNPNVLTAVVPHPKWYGEKSYLVHIPEQVNYDVCLFTTENAKETMNKQGDFPGPQKLFRLKPGTNLIELRQSNKEETGEHQISILVNNEPSILLEKEPGWMPESVSSSYWGLDNQCKSYQETELVLTQIQIQDVNRKPMTDEKKGIMVWLRKSGESK